VGKSKCGLPKLNPHGPKGAKPAHGPEWDGPQWAIMGLMWAAR